MDVKKKGKSHRIRKSSEYNELFKAGQRHTSEHIIAITKENDAVRYGIAVSRTISGAAKRNLARRRLRELVKINFEKLPANKSLVLLAKSSLMRARFSSLQLEFTKLMQRIK